MDTVALFNPAEFHFLRPLWLLAIVPAMVLAWIILKDKAANSEWRKAIQPELLAVLLEKKSEHKNIWVSILTAIGLVLMALALAGPTWNRLPQRMEQKNDALVIILDLSLSMYAQDLSPSRLIHARHKITDILRTRDEGYTALVVYAGDAHIVTPLTDDTDTIENLLLSLRPAMMPVAGSNPELAVELARNLITSAHLLRGRILLLTDGISEGSDLKKFASRDIPISILGIGTKPGGPIPLDFMNRKGDFLPDSQGRQVIAKLDTSHLEKIASRSFGRFRQSGIGDADIRYLLGSPIGENQETKEVERQFDVWADRGYLLLLLLIPLMAISFRRGFLLILCIAILPSPVRASTLDDFWSGLWQRTDQQAYNALNSGQAEKAAQLFQQQDWQATAEYRAGAFDSAASTFSSLEQNYNAGNAFAKLGNYSGAIKAYEKVLAKNPTHENAQFNKQLVEQLKQEQDQQSSDPDKEEEQEDRSQDNQSSDASQQDSSTDSGDQQKEEDQQQPSQEKKQDKEQKSEQQADPKDQPKTDMQSVEEESRDEQQEAMEQWLRRVPDDPGGLLKRKFQHETNQRLRRGEYQAKKSEQVW